MALEITDAIFEEVVLKSDKPVVVDFWAAWCGPCRMVGPIIDELSTEYEGKAIVGKVDVDNHQQFPGSQRATFPFPPPPLSALLLARPHVVCVARQHRRAAAILGNAQRHQLIVLGKFCFELGRRVLVRIQLNVARHRL